MEMTTLKKELQIHPASRSKYQQPGIRHEPYVIHVSKFATRSALRLSSIPSRVCAQENAPALWTFVPAVLTIAGLMSQGSIFLLMVLLLEVIAPIKKDERKCEQESR